MTSKTVKTVAKKTVAKKTVAKKPVAKKTVAKKTVAAKIEITKTAISKDELIAKADKVAAFMLDEFDNADKAELKKINHAYWKKYLR